MLLEDMKKDIDEAVKILEYTFEKVVDSKIPELLAKFDKEYVEALMKYGFSREEAIQIVKDRRDLPIKSSE